MVKPESRPNYVAVDDRVQQQASSVSSSSGSEDENVVAVPEHPQPQRAPRVTSLFEALAEDDEDDDVDLVMITEDANTTNITTDQDEMPPSQRRKTH